MIMNIFLILRLVNIKLNTSAKFILDQLKKDCEYNDVIKLISENFTYHRTSFR